MTNGQSNNIFEFNYIVPRAGYDDLKELYLCQMVGYAVIPIEDYQTLVGKEFVQIEGYDKMLSEALAKLKKKNTWSFRNTISGGE